MDSLQVSLEDDFAAVIREVETSMRKNFLDLELIKNNRSRRRNMLPKSRIPLFVLRKIGPSVVSGVLLGFAKVCQPVWRLCDYIEYFEAEAQSDVILIFIQRIKKYEMHRMGLAEVSELADALNRISHFPEWDRALQEIVGGLSVDLARRLQKDSPVSQKGILLNALLTHRSGESVYLENQPNSDTFEYHGIIRREGQSMSPIKIIRHSEVLLQPKMKCAIFFPQSPERRPNITYIENEDQRQKQIHSYDILIIRGHGIPRNSLEIIEQARPKIVFFGGCQGIDTFLEDISRRVRGGGTLDAFRGVTYIGTVRMGRAVYNDSITNYILSHLHGDRLTMDISCFPELTDGSYTSFSLE